MNYVSSVYNTVQCGGHNVQDTADIQAMIFSPREILMYCRAHGADANGVKTTVVGYMREEKQTVDY